MSTNGAPAWRRVSRRLLASPGIRLLAPGWPDAGRRVVQMPALESLLVRATEAMPSARIVVNAGVGEGLYRPVIQRFFGNARMIEFDFGQLQPSADRRIHRFRASLTAIPLHSGTADLVVCTEVLEHVADDHSAVAELRRVLTPGGFLVLSVPTPPAVFDPAHAREGYTLDQLRKILDAHGLTIVEARFCMHRIFRAILRHWRPYRVPLGAILGLAWLDRLLRPGLPMDLAVLARPRPPHGAAGALGV